MPGARCARSLVCSVLVVHTSVVTTVTPEITRHSLRNGFNGVFRALPGDEFVLSPSSADMDCLSPVGPTRLRRLSTSNGCQDHTVLPSAKASFVCAPFGRSRVFRQPALRPHHAHNAAASTASSPASMTMANAPLGDRTARDIDLSRVR